MGGESQRVPIVAGTQEQQRGGGMQEQQRGMNQEQQRGMQQEQQRGMTGGQTQRGMNGSQEQQRGLNGSQEQRGGMGWSQEQQRGLNAVQELSTVQEQRVQYQEQQQQQLTMSKAASMLPTTSTSPTVTYITEEEQHRTFCLADFEIGKRLGAGRFGRVYLAREKKTKFLVALKVVSISQIKRANLAHQMAREIEIQSKLRHKGVLRLFGHFHDDKNIYLILEYCHGKELFKYLQHKGKFTEEKAARYIKQITEAMHYLHEKNVIHRDIKPENLLLDYNGDVKISDFGWSVHTSSDQRKTMCGTLDYLSPEMIEQTPYSKSVDVWAIGVLTFEFLTGDAPFVAAEDRETKHRIRKVQYDMPRDISLSAQDFIRRILVAKPENRMSLTDILRHPWIVQMNSVGAR